MCLFKQCGDVFEIHIISHLQNFILLKTTVISSKGNYYLLYPVGDKIKSGGSAENFKEMQGPCYKS